MSEVAVGTEIFLKDYKTPNYWIRSTDLEISLNGDHAIVSSNLELEKNSEHNANSLTLNGIGLELLSIKINEEVWPHYVIDGEFLKLTDLPSQCRISTVVKIYPEKNLTGEGLYKSGNIFCTQCEAEGFRRITYYLDRPDVMAQFKTKLIADKLQYPFLLSNGNMIDQGDLEDNRHFATWEDPFKKPCYLFACVFGNLALVKDVYRTKSGRDVSLEIYVDHGNEEKCSHAMKSLKNSMKWDEDVFGLEYDLDIYMVVAVDSFNMGAMENKGLNIFNSAYVLAKQETATDSDFQGIEGVIGHEYFHNWTGNRVTCRDWFQLTLKEGLTVFRDQEFSSDMLARSVKRIEDVKGLRTRQFIEDGGPLSHPIKPKSFFEISNFYTSTIYEKGAEVIRMIHTILGAENFIKGMKLYFKRHDGFAVTTDDFLSAMADASGINLDHFGVWYDQNGTPRINVEMTYDKHTKICKLKIIQTHLQLNNTNYESLQLPFHIALFSENGDKIEILNEGKLLLSKQEETFVYENIASRPTLSLNRNFTAPVIVNYNYSEADLSILMSYDDDDFNRYDAAQLLTELEIFRIAKDIKEGLEAKVSDQYFNAYEHLLNNERLSHAFRAFALEFPTLNELNDKSDFFDFDYLPRAIEYLKTQVATRFEDILVNFVFHLDQKGIYSLGPSAMGERSLKNYALSLLSATKSPTAFDMIFSQFQKASNMTDEISSLAILVKSKNPYAERAMDRFYHKWQHETLVMQKWLRVQACSPITTLEDIENLEKMEIYNPTNPNLFRSLIASLARSNPILLHDITGAGYKFIADRVIQMDAHNPQIAAGLCKSLNFLKKLDPTRAHLLKIQLIKIKSHKSLSTDTLEVVLKNLS